MGSGVLEGLKLIFFQLRRMSTAPFYFLGLVLNCVIFSSDTGPLQSALITSHICYSLEMFNCLWLQLVRMALKLDKRVYYVLAFLTVLFMFFIGSRSSPIILFVFAVCTGSMVFAIYLAKWVLAKDEGPPEMSEVLPGLGPLWSISYQLYLLQLSALHSIL